MNQYKKKDPTVIPARGAKQTMEEKMDEVISMLKIADPSQALYKPTSRRSSADRTSTKDQQHDMM